MKYIDEYAGRILCRLLSLRGLQHNSPPGTDSVKNILFIKFWGMGSIILATPAVKSVRARYPNAKLHFLSFGSNREVLSLIPEIQNITTIRLTNPFAFVLDTIKTIFALRKQSLDIVFDFEFFTYYSALITRLIKAKYTVGFNNHKNRRSTLFTNTVEFNDHIHTRENFLHLVSADGIGGSFTLLKAAENNLPPELKARPYIVVNPNASKMAYERRLPAAYFVKLVDSLTADAKYNIVFTGSIEEKSYVKGIISKMAKSSAVIDLSGKLSVSELAALIAGAKCLITNDSGPLHIASAMDTPVVAFYGPESPVRYGALSTRQLVFYRGLECSPCMSISNSKTVNCVHNEPICMTGFDINEIIVEVRRFLVS